MPRIGLPKPRWIIAAVLLCVLLGGAASAGPPRNVSQSDLATLYELLETGNHFKVRVQAAKALGLMKVVDATPHLIKALRVDKDHLVRGTAAWALGSIGHPGTVDALALAEKTDVEFVGKQAGRARSHIIARFPGNLPGPELTNYHLRMQELGTSDPGARGLVPWLIDGIATRFVERDNFDFGEEMELEGEGAEVPDDHRPVIRLDLTGGIRALSVPANRAPGDVTVTVALGALWLPPKRTLMKTRTFQGTAPFAGGPPPKSELDEDPLAEAKKAALDAAAVQAVKALSETLKLHR
ncbi:MAG: HEAT repeat domain-containing protein [Pseudomonadota bacterium]